MIKYQKGYNPFNILDTFDEELKKYYEILVTYGNFPLNNDDYISKLQFSSPKDLIAYIYHDKKTCKELNEPKVYFTLRIHEWCNNEKCYYYDEYEIHFHRNGKLFTKAI